MDTIAIVKTLRVSRDTFDLYFRQAQDLPKPLRFDVVAEAAVGEAAFEQAIDYARSRGFLDRLLHLLLVSQLADPTLNAYFDATDRGRAELQAITNPSRLFDDPVIASTQLKQHSQWVCKVCIDGVSFGTGVLIGPNLVLTAYHVVYDLFVPDLDKPNRPLRPDPKAASRLSTEFDNYYELREDGSGRQLRTSKKVVAHTDWCVTYVGCHDKERQHTLPDNLIELENLFDFVVIRLATAIGDKDRWFKQIDDDVVVPHVGQPLLVYQHPGGLPLKYSDGNIVAPKKIDVAVFPRLRFLHTANTEHGSSGGPCFDRYFNLIGLHQGTWDHGRARKKQNRAVPIMGIRTYLQKALRPDLATPLIWSLGDTEDNVPVLGCDEFQRSVWRSVQAWKEQAKSFGSGHEWSVGKQLFSLNGLDAGTGKTFRTKVLAAMLPASEHLLVNVPAQTIAKRNASDVANIIAQAIEHKDSQISPPPPDTTATARLGPDLWAPLLSQLEKNRNGRLVWVILTDMNKYNFDGEGTTDLLTLMYRQVTSLNWLRIVLDGMRGDLPVELMPYLEQVDTPNVTAEDIDTYLRTFLTSYNLKADDSLIKGEVVKLINAYAHFRQQDAGSANATLASTVMISVGKIMLKLLKPGPAV